MSCNCDNCSDNTTSTKKIVNTIKQGETLTIKISISDEDTNQNFVVQLYGGTSYSSKILTLTKVQMTKDGDYYYYTIPATTTKDWSGNYHLEILLETTSGLIKIPDTDTFIRVIPSNIGKIQGDPTEDIPDSPSGNVTLYYTKTQVDTLLEDYAKESDLSVYAKTSDLPTNPVETSTLVDNYYSKSDIDSKGYITSTSLTPYIKSSEVEETYAKKDDLSEYWKTSDLTKVSQLENDSNYITRQEYQENEGKYCVYLSDDNAGENITITKDGEDKIKINATQPTKTSELTNDSGYMTSFTETDPIWTSEKNNYYTKSEVDGKGYLTEHQDISGKQDKLTAGDNITIVDNVISSTGGGGSSVTKTSELTNDSGFITIDSVPTKVSELTNDSGYMTSFTETDPIWTSEKSNYYTKSEVDGKGYLTEHQSLEDYEKKGDLETTLGSYYTKDDIDGKGYLTSFTESDPVWESEKSSYYTKTEIDTQIGNIETLLSNI